MNERPLQYQPEEPDCSSDVLDQLIESELSRRIEAPDMTRAIMGRLGYMRLPEATIRKRNRMKWVRRVATAACLGLVLCVGLLMHAQSADSRLPAGPTIPAALHESIKYGGERIDRALDTIRQLELGPIDGGSLFDLNVPKANEPVRNYRPELQRENQPPFRWV